jgi:hypothetical protein
MNTIRITCTGLSFGILVGASIGCAPDADDIGAEEGVEFAQADLTAAQKKLAGTYAFSTAANRIAFTRLVFEGNGSFVAEVNHLCRTPVCDGRIQGTYTATSTFVNLRASPGAPADLYYGKYRYTLTGIGTASPKLTLSRDGAAWSGWSNQAMKLPE